MALDQITKALVDEFLREAEMPSAGVATDFEWFAAYVVISPHIDAAIDYGNVMTVRRGYRIGCDRDCRQRTIDYRS